MSKTPQHLTYNNTARASVFGILYQISFRITDLVSLNITAPLKNYCYSLSNETENCLKYYRIKYQHVGFCVNISWHIYSTCSTSHIRLNSNTASTCLTGPGCTSNGICFMSSWRKRQRSLCAAVIKKKLCRIASGSLWLLVAIKWMMCVHQFSIKITNKLKSQKCV